MSNKTKKTDEKTNQKPVRKNWDDVVLDPKRKTWKIDIPASKSETGKRYKAWFKTRELAREHIKKISDVEDPISSIPPRLAMEADKAREILEPWNLDLVEAARELHNALTALGEAGTLLDAAKKFKADFMARNSSVTMKIAVEKFMETRETLRKSTQDSYRYTLERVFAGLHDDNMADITHEDLAAVLEGKGATSRAMHRRTLRALWNWSSSHPRLWCDTSAVDHLEKPRISNDNDISVLSAKEVKALLQAAEKENAGVAVAIAIFGGVRMAELGRLKWSNIKEKNIEIGKSIAKKHSRRLIPICPALRAWIDAYSKDKELDDLIVPPNWVDVFKSVRRRAGWDVAARLLDNPPNPKRGAWPTNACRHTCASVQVAIGTPLDELVWKFGHSGGHDLLRSHYVSRIELDEAIAILSIAPHGKTISNLKVA